MQACIIAAPFGSARAGKAVRRIENPAQRGAKFIFCLPTGSRLAGKAQQALGFRGVIAADCRYDRRTGTEVCSASKPTHSRPETSLVPKPAAHAGLSLDELVRWMVDDASLNR
jgi:hypothetical protein